jgi:YHS domain-containing protein
VSVVIPICSGAMQVGKKKKTKYIMTTDGVDYYNCTRCQHNPGSPLPYLTMPDIARESPVLLFLFGIIHLFLISSNFFSFEKQFQTSNKEQEKELLERMKKKER